MDGGLRLQVLEEGADGGRLALLAGYLRAELLRLDVEDVTVPLASEMPPGARGGAAGAVGALLITLGQSAERTFRGLRPVLSLRDQVNL